MVENIISMKMERVDTSPLRRLEKSKSHFERPTLKKAQALDEIHRSRLEVISEQNRNLLGENKELRQSLQEKLRMLHILEIKYDQQLDCLAAMEQERQQFITDVSLRNKINQGKIEELESQLQLSRNEATQIHREWQIKHQQSEVVLEKEMKKQLEHLGDQYARNIKILRSENSKLKGTIESKEKERSAQLMEHSNATARLRAQIQRGKEELQHKVEIGRVELNEAKKDYEDKLARVNLGSKREKELLAVEHESQRSRLQSQLDQLTRDIERLRMQLEESKYEERDNQQESLNIQALLLSEAAELKHTDTQARLKERKAQEGLWQEEQQQLQRKHLTEIALLSQENTRLLALFQLTSQETANIRQEIERLRQHHREELQVYEVREKQLRSKMTLQDITNVEHEHVASTKMAILRAADLTSMRKYYQNEMEVLSSMNLVKEAALQANRAKVHAELRSQGELRKYFQIETSKYQATLKGKEVEIIQLRSALKQQEHMGSQQKTGIESQIEAHSQREKRDKQAKWEDVRRLQAIILGKDEEIDQLEQKLTRIKEIHQGQLKEQLAQLLLLQEKNMDLEKEQSKSEKLSLAEIYKLKEGQSAMNQRHQLEMSTLRAENMAEVEKILGDHQEQTTSLRGRIHDLEGKMRILMDEHERLKAVLLVEESHKKEAFALWQVSDTEGNREKKQKEDYLRRMVVSKDCELEELREQLSEKESDLRDAKSNYYEMEQRMGQLMDSQNTLRELETKVMQLGLQNSSLFFCDIE